MSDTYQGDDDQDLDPDLDDATDQDLAPADDDLPPDDGGGDDAPDADEPPRRGRANDRIRTLADRAATAERERDDLRRQITEQLRPREPVVDPAADERAFQQRIQDLPVEQQIIAVRDRERQQFGQQLGGIRMEIAQARDEGAFSVLISSNPVAARHAAEVEKRASDFARGGNFVSRKVILQNLLGEIALERGPKAAARAGAQGRRRIDAEQGRPGARRSDSDARPGRRDDNSLEALEERLRGKFI